MCDITLTLVQEGDAIVGEESLELHGLRSATAAASAVLPLPSSPSSCAPRVWKGLAPEEAKRHRGCFVQAVALI